MRRWPALAFVAIGAVLLAGCAGQKPRSGNTPTSGRHDSRPADDTGKAQSERYRDRQDNGPAAPPIDVSKIPEPVPKVEPRSRYGNKPVYSVLGRSYQVLPSEKGYVERGISSWYGSKFHGYATSSFEPYDMYAFSAAHKTLPLPSYARVTNLDNGKSVVVRVNDRGPFHDNRLIDLSYAAAVKIGVWPKGTGRVEVRAIDPGRPETRTAMAARTPPRALPACGDDERPCCSFPCAAGEGAEGGRGRSCASAAKSASIGPPGSLPRCAGEATAVGANAARASALGAQPPARIYLQLGAFGERRNAERALADAQRAGLDRLSIDSVAVSGRTVHRVRVGPLADAAAADALAARIERLGLGAPRVAVER